MSDFETAVEARVHALRSRSWAAGEVLPVRDQPVAAASARSQQVVEDVVTTVGMVVALGGFVALGPVAGFGGADAAGRAALAWLMLIVLTSVAGGIAVTRAARRHPAPAGVVVHGHVRRAYQVVCAGPGRLRDLGASEDVVGRVEELVPVAEHLVEVCAQLRAEVVDTTGSVPHERLLRLAGEVEVLLDKAAERHRAVTEHAYVTVEPGSLADAAAALDAETTVVRAALDRAADTTALLPATDR